MSKLMIVAALLIGLSGCSAGFFIGDDGRGPAYAAQDAYGSAVAQAAIGTMDSAD